MQTQASVPRDGVVLAHGYGLKLYVERGHLLVHDGIGRQRQTRRYNRATSRLKRVVVIGHTGFVTLEALKWIRDVGATFVQIGADGELIAISAPARHHESQLRRAQANAPDSGLGLRATAELLAAKLRAQAEIADELVDLKAYVQVKRLRCRLSVGDAIRMQAETFARCSSFAELRLEESIAGRYYWQVWARLPVSFHRSIAASVPDHWHRAGARTATVENKKRGRKTLSPVHALLNYSYAIVQTEATIAAHKIGLDPSLGLMHGDRRYRNSLATDLMEPARPTADAIVLDLIQGRELQRGDVCETREGVCRVGPTMARELASHFPTLRAAVAPHAEQLARTLVGSAHPTPLTRNRHRDAQKRVDPSAGLASAP